MRQFFIILLLVMAVIILSVYNNLKASGPSINDKISLAFKKQEEINAKLKQIEELINQVRIRVYRKTGF